MYPGLTIWSRATQLQFVAHCQNYDVMAGKLSIAECTNAFVIQRMPVAKVIIGLKDR